MKKLTLVVLAAVLTLGIFGSASANESAAVSAPEQGTLEYVYAAPFVAFAETGPEFSDALAQQYAAPIREVMFETASVDYLGQQHAAPFREMMFETASVNYLGLQYAAPYRNADNAAAVVDFIGLQYAEQYVDGLRDNVQTTNETEEDFILAD